MNLPVDYYITGVEGYHNQVLEIDDKYAALVDQMLAFKATRFTAELLHAGQASLCFEHRDWGDYAIELISFTPGLVDEPGDGVRPQVREGFEKILNRFNLTDFKNWIKSHEEEEV